MLCRKTMRYLGHFHFLCLIFIGNDVEAQLKKYASLISDVHQFYRTSSVFFISSSHHRHLEEHTLTHLLSRDFSQKGVLSLIINFEEFGERTHFYRKRIGRPLTVVFLKLMSDIDEFQRNTKKINMSHTIWLVIFVNEFGAPICEHCNSPNGKIFNLRFDTEMLIVCCQNPVIKEWWNAREDSTEIADFAIWIKNKEFKVLTDESLYARRHGINGTSLRLALVSNSAFLRIKGTEISGFFADVLHDLERQMNFTISEMLKETLFGSMSESKRWSGVVGQVAERKADIGVAGFTITNDRLDVVDFTLPLFLSRNILFIKKPDGSRVQWSAYFQAFTLEIWMSIIIVIITTPILLTMIKVYGGSHLLPHLVIQHYIQVFGIFCQQGLSEFPVQTPLRVTYFSIFGAALIVSAAYSASLISFLTVSTINLPFTTMDGFADDGSYQLIVYQNSSDYDLFAVANDPVLVKMMALMKPWRKLPTTLEQGFKQVCREKVAFYTTEAGTLTMNTNPPCQIAVIDSGRTDSLAMIMPIDSQYTGVVNYHIQRFQDNGMLNRLKEKYFVTSAPIAKTYDVVTISGVAPVLAVLAGGMVLASIILFIERYYSSIKNIGRKKRQVGSQQIMTYRWFNARRNAEPSEKQKMTMTLDYRNGEWKHSLVGYYP